MIGAGIPKAQLMDSETMARVLTRMAHEIMERAGDLQDLILVGIRRRGVPLAQRLADVIEKVEGVRVPVGELDITLYRDDLSKLYDQPKVNHSKLDMPITGKTIILVDDVLYTGRTARAAIDALFALGRPGKIRLAVLVDRGHRELPIRPDYVGKNIPTALSEVIKVHIAATDGKTGVDICKVVQK